MALSISPSPFGTLAVVVKDTPGSITVSTVATSPSVLTMALGVPGPAGSQGPAGANGQNGTNGTNGTNGQGVPTGGTTGQALVKTSGTDYATGWASINSAAWGNITGTLSNQTDLQTRLDAKFPLTGGAMSPDAQINLISNDNSSGINISPNPNFGIQVGRTNSNDDTTGTVIRPGLFYVGENDGSFSFKTNYGFGGSGLFTEIQGGLKLDYLTFSDNSTQASAFIPSNYLTASSIASTYLSKSSAASTYLSQSSAASAYLTQSSAASAYLTQSSAASTYYTKPSGTTSQYIRGDGSLNTFPAVGDRYLTSSTSTLTINNDNGKTMTVGTGLSYSAQQDITVFYDTGNHMHGTVISYNSTTGVMVFDGNSHSGSGTYSTWTVNVGGVPSGAILPVSGTAGQVLSKINSTNYNTEWVSLGSMATETATNYLTTSSAASVYAPLASPVFTGDPKAPTPLTADNDTSIATTAFVKAQGYLTTAPVTSVAGRTGVVTLSTADISGLGTSATNASTVFAQVANNLSDVTASTARTNLGLTYATDAQVIAGTSASTVMTPAGGKNLRYTNNGSESDLTPYSWLSSFTTWAGTRNRLNFPINGTTAIGQGMWSIENQFANIGGVSASSGIDWSKRITLVGRFNFIQTSPSSNNVFRYTLGKVNSTTFGDLGNRGIGVRCLFGSALEIQCHNGTSLTNFTTSFTPTFNNTIFEVRVESDGSGNCTCFVNGTQVGTTTGAPTTASSGTQYWTNFELVSATTNTNAPTAAGSAFKVNYGQ